MNCSRILSVTVLCVLLFAALASAQTTFVPNGSAMVPCLYSHQANGNINYQTSFMVISNISSTPVQCRVLIYDHNGNDVSSTYARVYTGGTTSLTEVSSGVNTFDIPANSTRMFQFYQPSMPAILGYGVIEWTSTDEKQRKALIAGVMTYNRQHVDSDAATKHLVNNGQPF